jgi:hypothetical protein
MLVEKIENLKNKDYYINYITAHVIIHNNESTNDLNLQGQGAYFGKEIYKDGKGFSNKYYSPFVATKVPRYKTKEIITKVMIDFYVEVKKLIDTTSSDKIRVLLEKITEDILDSLKIKHDNQVFKVNYYKSQSISQLFKENKKKTVTITVNYGTENFDNISKNKPSFLRGIAEIIKVNTIINYI